MEPPVLRWRRGWIALIVLGMLLHRGLLMAGDEAAEHDGNAGAEVADSAKEWTRLEPTHIFIGRLCSPTNEHVVWPSVRRTRDVVGKTAPLVALPPLMPTYIQQPFIRTAPLRYIAGRRYLVVAHSRNLVPDNLQSGLAAYSHGILPHSIVLLVADLDEGPEEQKDRAAYERSFQAETTNGFPVASWRREQVTLKRESLKKWLLRIQKTVETRKLSRRDLFGMLGRPDVEDLEANEIVYLVRSRELVEGSVVKLVSGKNMNVRFPCFVFGLDRGIVTECRFDLYQQVVKTGGH